ncbi:hypothetical protein ABZ477_18650 [Microbacterium sp. NPDC019599]|uniref:hypothetical protein n=1 Tax=Microbacterium sp. NPDC019599 TaxID=3154690 RepID=UPI0033F52E39
MDPESLRAMSPLDAAVELRASRFRSEQPSLQQLFPESSATELAVVAERVAAFISWAYGWGDTLIDSMRASDDEGLAALRRVEDEWRQSWSDFSRSSYDRAVNHAIFTSR